MPGTRTVDYLIKRVRDEVQVFENPQVLIDGYASEESADPKATSILRQLNWALGDLRDTGFNKCYFTLALVVGQIEYTMPRAAHDIEDAYLTLTGSTMRYPLEKTSLHALNAYHGGALWRTQSRTRPESYYQIGTRAIGLGCLPLSSNYTITFLADTLVADMALPTDIPAMFALTDENGDPVLLNGQPVYESSLPEDFHEAIAIGAAYRIARYQGDWTQAGLLKDEWDRKKKDLKGMSYNRAVHDTVPLRIVTPRSGRWGSYSR